MKDYCFLLFKQKYLSYSPYILALSVSFFSFCELTALLVVEYNLGKLEGMKNIVYISTISTALLCFLLLFVWFLVYRYSSIKEQEKEEEVVRNQQELR